MSIYKNRKKTDKIFTNHRSDKGLLSRTYKEFLKRNNKKTTQLKKKLQTV